MNKDLQTTHYKLQTKYGFTLIELLLSIAIIAIISAIVIPIFRTFQSSNDLNVARDYIVQSLRRAQLLSQAVSGDTSWGVSAATSTITLFRGISFNSRDTNYDEIFEIPTTISFSDFTEIIFTKFTGEPVATGTLRFIGVDNETRAITINEKGTISF